MTSSISTFTIYSICHSPQKSSAVQKVYRAGLAAEGRLCLSTTSQSHSVRQGRVAAPSVCFAAACIPLAAAPTAPPCFRHWRRSSPLPLVGEPLAKPFTLRGLPKPPLPGEVARRRRDGEVVRRKACPRTRPMTERFTPKRYSLYTNTSLVYPESMIK